MNGTEGGGGGAETVEEAMDVAVTAPQRNLISTDAQSQDTHTPAAALVTEGDVIIYNNLMLGTLA